MMFDAGALDAVLAETTGNGSVVGAVVAIAHHGNVRIQAAGLDDRETGRVMAPDAVFRLASLTKAVVCVAALALAERGTIDLDQPVTDWLAWFTPRLPGGEQPRMAIRQLLTHQAGLGYGFAQPGSGGYRAAGISDGMDDSGLTLEDNLRRLTAVPLLHAPGTAWSYSLSIDVLGAVLEAACRRPLGEILARLVFDPLGLHSLAFVAAPGAPLVTPYASGPALPVRMSEHFVLPMGSSAIHFAPDRAWRADAFPSGGTGLIGNARDYLTFLDAIRSGGTPILSRPMAEAFITHAVGDAVVGLPGSGLGWGLGVAIVRDPDKSGSPLSAGSWQWGGVYGHSYWVDPAAALSIVLLTNTAGAGMSGAFPDAVRRAVVDGLPLMRPAHDI
jgi:CubicO group peptidase (beta-lactamase class C family)